MKKCVKCQNDLPDSAVHCVFCGTRQPALPASVSPPGANRTMMGYPGMAADLIKQVQQQSSPYPASDPGSAPTAYPPNTGPAYAPTAPPDPQVVSPFGATAAVHPDDLRNAAPYGAPAGSGGSQPIPPTIYASQPPPGIHPPPPSAPRQQSPSQSPPPYGMPPGPGPGPGPYGPPPGMGGPPPGMGGPPPGMGGPPPGMSGPPPGMSGPPGQMPGPGPARPGDSTQPPPYGPGGPIPTLPPASMPAPGMPGGPMGGSMAGPVGKGRADAGPETEQVKPLPPPKPPRAATAAGANPIEPWAESIKTLMLVFGVLLVACFVAPWKVTEAGTVFSWTALKGGDAYSKVVVLLLVGTGVLAVVLGALPLGARARAMLCLVLGVTPVIYMSVAGGFVWQTLVGAIGSVLLIGGLLVRSQYTRAKLGRILVTIGALCVLLTVLVPFSLGALFSGIGAAPLPSIARLVPIIVAVLSLMAWLPGPGRAMSGLFAWILILWPLIGSVLSLLGSGDVGGAIKGGLDTYFYSPLALVAWTAMAAYGLATFFGKKLENAA